VPRVAPADPASLFVSVDESGRLLSLSPWTIRDLIARGVLPARRLGTRVLISRRVLEELAEPPSKRKDTADATGHALTDTR